MTAQIHNHKRRPIITPGGIRTALEGALDTLSNGVNGERGTLWERVAEGRGK